MKLRSPFFNKINKTNKAQSFNIRNERVDITTEFVDILGIKSIVVKKPPANAGDARDSSLIPGPGRSPGVGNDNPLQYSYLGNLWTEEPGRRQSMGSQNRQDSATKHK